MSNKQQYQPVVVTKDEWAHAKCDKYDYMIAAFCGAAAGLVDIFFVKSPTTSKVGKFTDSMTDEIVKRAARLCGWKPKAGNEDNIASAIGFFERNYKVNYDQKTTMEVGNVFNMAAKNHHYKSLSHSPDPIGLFFSILDQFMNTSSFLDNGKLIRIDTSNVDSPMRGGNLCAKLFSGFCNWIGHIMSDIAGSSGSRGVASNGRGTGVSIPFMELFQLCDFGKFQVGQDRQTLATVMTRVFQEGYDARFGAAMAIPVLMEELMIRTIWVIRQRFFEKDWSECFPSKEHADLRIMLIVGNATLCLIDGTDAAIHSALKGGNIVEFILHLNIIAWARLIFLVLRELKIRFGSIIVDIMKKFKDAILYGIVTPKERERIQAFYERMQALDIYLKQVLEDFIAEVEAEYRVIYKEIEETFSKKNSTAVQASHSVKLAQACGVEETKIIKDLSELDAFFNED
jgi:hypothetical protein